MLSKEDKSINVSFTLLIIEITLKTILEHFQNIICIES
jgi:hypothetical protein